MRVNINKLNYKIDGIPILNEISLGIRENEFVGLIGPNGCGKTTLLKHICKTTKPDKNVVFIDGKDVMTLTSREMAQKISVMAQENSVQFDVDVLEMVKYGRYSHRKFWEREKKEDVELCRHYIREVGMEGYENRSYLSLSGGEKQRVLLARALVQKSQFIVLDEPTNHLDVRYQYQILQTLKKQDITVLASIHDLNLAAMYCDRIILMNKGSIIATGTPEEVITEKNVSEIFKVKSQITVNKITGKVQVYYLP